MNNFKEISKTLTIAICIVLTVALVSTVLMFVMGVKDDIYTPPPKAEEEIPPFDPTLNTTHDYGDIYLNQMIIFCDSTFAEILKFNVLKDTSIIVTGKDGDMPLDFNCASTETNKPAADGSTQSITDVAADQTPKYLLIFVGLNNGVEHCSEQKFKQYYQKLIDSIASESPETKIILASFFERS